MTGPVRYRLDEAVAHITMDDGKLNVMSLDMLEALHGAVDQAGRDEAVIVLTSGREAIFSAGFDLKIFAAGDAARSQAMVRSGAELALKLLAYPNPVLSACQGHAYPMGAFLLLASDLRIGAEGDYRMGLNEVAIGIAAPSFAVELARQRLHPAYLNRTAVTGEMFGPTEAQVAGFLDVLVPPSAFETAVADGAKRLMDIHRPSHATVKRRVRRGAIAAVRAAIDAELTLGAYQSNAGTGSSVRLPGAA